MKIIYTFLLTVLLLGTSKGQSCDSTDITFRTVRTNLTDASLPFELAGHHVFLNTKCSSKNVLLVYLVGSYDNPTSTIKFPSLAANNGYHAVSLRYPNGVAAKTACANSTDVNCYLNFRKEIIEGIDYSSEVSVDASNSINNRLLKLIQYLDANHPTESWGQYYSGSAINWSKIATAGHSQGGGHAAVMGISNSLNRVLMFSSPNDYSNHFGAAANCCGSSFATPDSVFYGFNNLHDDVVTFSSQKQVWDAMSFSMNNDTALVDQGNSPYNQSHLLYTSYQGSGGTSENHNATVRDSDTPILQTGRPTYESVWKYMLGVSDGITSVAASKYQNDITVFPNPTSAELFIKGLKEDVTTVLIYDVHGKIRLNHRVFSSSGDNSSAKINVEFLPSGIYVCKLLHLNGETVNFTFVLQ